MMNALAMPQEVPSGTVALVFTDIQGSTLLWERCSAGMRAALELHDRILRTLLATTGGYEVKTQGDSFMVAFPRRVEAVRWCLDAQEALLKAPWPSELLAQPEAAEERGPQGLLYRGLRVRMGVHVGEPELRMDRAHGPGRLRGPHGERGGARGGCGPWRPGAAERRGVGARGGPGGGPGAAPVRMLGSFRLQGHRRARPAGGACCPLRWRTGASTSLRVRGSGAATCPSSRATSSAARRSWRRCGCGSRRARGSITILGPGGMGKTPARHPLRQPGVGHAHVGGRRLAVRSHRGATAEDICHAVGQALGVHADSGGGGERSGGAAGRAR